MPLDFQLQQAPLAFGLAEGTDPHHAPFGTLMTAENCRWVRGGRVEKRHGLVPIGGAPVTTSRLSTRGSELLALAMTGIFARSSSGAWQSRGALPEYFPTTRALRGDGRGVACADTVTLNDGTVVTAWVTGEAFSLSTATGGALFFQLTDASGTAIYNSLYASTVASVSTANVLRCKLVTDGTLFGLVYLAGSSIYAITGTATTTSAIATIGAISGTVSGANQPCPLDASVASGLLYIAHVNSSRFPCVTQCNFLATPTLITTTQIAATLAYTVAVDAFTNGVHAAYITATDAMCAWINGISMNVIGGPTSLDTFGTADVRGGNAIGVCATGQLTSVFCWSVAPNAAAYVDGIARMGSVVVTSGGTVITPGAKSEAPQQAFISKPWVVSGTTYALTASGFMGAAVGSEVLALYSGGDINVVAFGTPTMRVAAKVETVSGAFWRSGHMANAIGAATRRIMYPVLDSVSPTGPLASAIVRAGVRELTITMDRSNVPDALRSVSVGPETDIAAGMLCSYDGIEALGVGMSHPTWVSSVSVSTTGGTIAAGTYLYNAYGERRSAAGIVHRGPTGAPKSVTTTGATSSTTPSFVPVWYSLSTVPSSERVVAFRTTLGDSQLKRLPTVYVANAYSSTSSVVSGSDLSSDANYNLAAQPFIYTATGELDDYQPPAAKTMTAHQNRIFMVAPDGLTLWLSKDPTANAGTAPGFHPTMTLAFTEPVTALASMDSGLIVFTATGLYIVQGDGPTPNGQNATYQVIKVQTDVGCTNPRSVVSMPDGIMFQSTRGLYLVTRGLEVVFVGKTVQATTRNASVTSAVLVARRGEVRFTLSTGVSAVYNYFEKQWTTAKYTSGGTYGAAIVDACMWNGAYTVLFADGNVASESETSYLDGAVWVPMTMETSWNNAAGPLAYQSVRMFSAEGYSSSDHKLTVSVGFNNDTTYAQTFTWNDGTPVTSIGPFEQFEVSIGIRRKCQSIRFLITDAAPATLPVGTGQGPAFDTIGVQVGVKRGFNPKSVGRSA